MRELRERNGGNKKTQDYINTDPILIERGKGVRVFQVAKKRERLELKRFQLVSGEKDRGEKKMRVLYSDT